MTFADYSRPFFPRFLQSSSLFIPVLILSIALKTVAFILGCSYIFIDLRLLGKGMTLSEKARMKREEEIEDRDGSSRLSSLPAHSLSFSSLTFPHCLSSQPIP